MMLKLQTTLYQLRSFQSNFQRVLRSFFSNGRFRSPHQILGVNRNASDGQVKAAYYKLAKLHHPDISKEDSSKDKFTQINQAYQKMMNRTETSSAAQSKTKSSKHNRKSTVQNEWESQDQQFQYQDNFTQQNDRHQYFKNKKKSANLNQEEAYGNFQKMTQGQIGRMFQQYINYGKIKGKFGKTYQRIFQELFDFEQDPHQNSSARGNRNKKKKNPEYYSEKDNEQQVFSEYKSANQKKDKQNMSNKSKLDIKLEIKLDFFQAVSGGKKLIKLVRKFLCQSCSGKSKYSKTQCLNCLGSGYRIRESISKRGDIQIFMDDCKQCQGRGLKRTPQCQTCKGKNCVQKKVQQIVFIPQCVENQSVLTLKGRGHQQRQKGTFGDLIIKFIAQQKCEEQNFIRQGQNIYGESQVSIVQAVLGGIINVKTIWGLKQVKLKQGTQDGELIKLKGEGWRKKSKKTTFTNQRNKEDFGDHILKVVVKVPKNISNQIKSIYKEIQSLDQEMQKKSYYN